MRRLSMMRCGIWLVALRGRGQAKENIAVSTDGLVPIKRITNWELYRFHDYERFKEFSISSFFFSSIFFWEHLDTERLDWC